MSTDALKHTLEAALLAAGQPITVNKMLDLFSLDAVTPARDDIKQALAALREDYEGRGIELIEVASGFRLQVCQEQEPWIARLWEEKPPRYSRALLETLVLIAYRQPITRGEIEDVRGVSVSTQIIKTLLEREWVRVVGHREVPGKPAMYGTTRQFLDYFNLKRLDELPELADIKDLDKIHPELALDAAAEEPNREHQEGVGDADLNNPDAESQEGTETEAAAEAVTSEDPAESVEAESDMPEAANDVETDDQASTEGEEPTTPTVH